MLNIERFARVFFCGVSTRLFASGYALKMRQVYAYAANKSTQRRKERFIHDALHDIQGPITWQISARAEIAARLPGNFSPVKRAEKPHVIAFKFQPGMKYELGHTLLFSCAQKRYVKHFPANVLAQF